jgi:hypothetical protein
MVASDLCVDIFGTLADLRSIPDVDKPQTTFFAGASVAEPAAR